MEDLPDMAWLLLVLCALPVMVGSTLVPYDLKAAKDARGKCS